jgi:hypothetical protein
VPAEVELALPVHAVDGTNRRSAPVTRLVHLTPPSRALRRGPGPADQGGDGSQDPGPVLPGLLLCRAAGPAGGAGQRIVLGLAVQVVEPGLSYGGDVGGKHGGLPAI